MPLFLRQIPLIETFMANRSSVASQTTSCFNIMDPLKTRSTMLLRSRSQGFYSGARSKINPDLIQFSETIYKPAGGWSWKNESHQALLAYGTQQQLLVVQAAWNRDSYWGKISEMTQAAKMSFLWKVDGCSLTQCKHWTCDAKHAFLNVRLAYSVHTGEA